MDGYEFCRTMNLLKFSSEYRRILIDQCKNRFNRFFLVIRLKNPNSWPLDLIWNYKLDALFHRCLELEKLMWWLSTLGGAFSALGDHAESFAKKAAICSLEQLKIALNLGDPILIARCKLFIALSFIQTGRLRYAKRLIKEQYKFAITCSSNGKQLKNACLGVWSKLQYYYSIRRQKFLLGSSIVDSTNNFPNGFK